MSSIAKSTRLLEASTRKASLPASHGNPLGCSADLSGLGAGTPFALCHLGIGFSLARLKVPHGIASQSKITLLSPAMSSRSCSWSPLLVRSSFTHGTSGECRLSSLSTAMASNPFALNAAESLAHPQQTSAVIHRPPPPLPVPSFSDDSLNWYSTGLDGLLPPVAPAGERNEVDVDALMPGTAGVVLDDEAPLAISGRAA